MSDSEQDDLDGLAGEYVLGTLAGDDRVQFEARINMDAAAARAVADWAQRLQPMADAVPPAIPPAALWQRIVVEVGPSRKPWRHTWIAAVAAAAVLVVALFIGNQMRAPGVTAVAELAAQSGATAFTVSVLEDRAKLLIRAGTVDQLQNQSYELWAVPPSGAPVSLGLVNASGETEADVPPERRALLESGITLAVSLEPEGGSPIGAPTGPVLFAGTIATPQ